MTENHRLKFLRKELKLTQEKFSARIGLERSSISALETGTNAITPKLKILLRSIFNVNIEWLETGKGYMFSVPKGSDQENSTQQINVFRESLIDMLKDLAKKTQENAELLKKLIDILENK